MKGFKASLFLLLISLLGLGIAMFVTNPKPETYDEFATQRLTEYLENNVCPQADALKETCNDLLKNNQQEIKKFISENTERENFGVFSIYKTDFSLGHLLPPFLGNLLPNYQFETVGVLSGFHLYKQERKN